METQKNDNAKKEWAAPAIIVETIDQTLAGVPGVTSDAACSVLS